MCIQPMKKDQDTQKNARDILTFYAMQEDTREDRHQFWQDRARQLLQSYRTMKKQAERAAGPLPDALKVLDQSLQQGKQGFDLEEILQNPNSCASVCRYIEYRMQQYQVAADKRDAERRRWRVLYSRYLAPRPLGRVQLCAQEFISKSTLYRDESAALERLSVLLFGVVAGM